MASKEVTDIKKDGNYVWGGGGLQVRVWNWC